MPSLHTNIQAILTAATIVIFCPSQAPQKNINGMPPRKKNNKTRFYPWFPPFFFVGAIKSQIKKGTKTETTPA
jgi:hypothetical protein